MGLEPGGWNVIFSNDISPKKHRLYRGFFPDKSDHYVVGDIFAISPQSVPQTLLATCSFPCIDLSLAGNMSGLTGAHSSAFWGFVRILKAQAEVAPPLVLVENVHGWLHSNRGADFRITVQALNELGYVCDVFALDALRFTPQSRPRIFLVGAKNTGKDLSPAEILSRSKALLPDALRRSVLMNLDLHWSALGIPEPPPLMTGSLSVIVEDMPEADERWWPEEEVERHLQMMERAHLERVRALVDSPSFTYRTFYRRIRGGLQRAEVRQDDIAGCLRTAIGGSGKQFLIRAGHGRVRMRTMTAREYARLQGVPDAFPIVRNGIEALTGFGDAVCVPAITWIATNVLNPLARTYLARQA
ncbi:MAG: DNA (cytosine-5-)-methyltransferase [Anaerolineae bacterium]|nr:DNA (cytosine-5-)-methyltransferase [Anaerolineae bacterium]